MKDIKIAGISIFISSRGIELEFSSTNPRKLRKILVDDCNNEETVVDDVLDAYKYTLEQLVEVKKTLDRRF